MNAPRPNKSLEVERMKARSRAKHRERIADAHEAALLRREQYDEQLDEHGEIGRELHGELAYAAFRLYDQTHTFSDDAAVADIYPDIRPVMKEIVRYDGHVADYPDTDAKTFAAFIDAFDTVLRRVEFVGEVNA